jgi:SAM-dependent methyltransferase
MRDDLWLDRWLPLVRERSAGQPLLELGCGTGRDTATLVRAGHRVVALDLSLASIALAKLRAPKAKFHRQDLRRPFPIGEAGAAAVIASLSLHYFPWPETVELVERIRRTLRPNGVLLCRLNSTKDRHFGAIGHQSIAENFYLVRGAPKRFFDLESIDKLFAAGWSRLSVHESVIDRYVRAKTVWEIVLERAI